MSTNLNKPLIFILDNDATIAAMLPLELQDQAVDAVAFRFNADAEREFQKLYTQADYKSPTFLVDIAISKEKTGWDFVDFVRRYDKDALVFMFTGAAPNRLIDKYLLSKHQANGFIRKPKDGLEILAEIKKYQTQGRGSEFAQGQSGFLIFTPKEAVFALVVIIWMGICLVEMTYRSNQMGQIIKVQEQIISNQNLQILRIDDTREDVASYGMLNKNGPYGRKEQTK